MLHEEVILTNTTWWPGPVAAINLQPPPTHIHPHTITPTATSLTELSPCTAVSPVCQSHSCSTPLSPAPIMRDMGVSGKLRQGKLPHPHSLLTHPPPLPPRGVTGAGGEERDRHGGDGAALGLQC
ncbi:unnamed protein product [Pleuronectes platessa]|uniref:Uncharacterized protein n=1 Tax=Pleuronectes platessa TaxID=8262 RepID=A0A9N7VIZ2_PLEPL|nr:unnamed protein product [Pleuronectes platessa]